MALIIILTAVALSAPVAESSASQEEPVVSSEGRVSRGALPPDARRNVRESAHVLGHGELLLGTDGVAVGVLPSVQLSTQALLDVVGWFNGGVKVEAVRGRHLSLSVQGAGAAASWGEMQGRHLDVGSTASLTLSPGVSLHGGARYGVLSMEGVPTDLPPVLAEWVPMEALWGAASASQAAGLVPRVYERHTEVRGAAEVRINRRDSLVLCGAWTVWGQNGTDLLTTVPGSEPLEPLAQQAVDWAEGLGRTGNRRVSLSYRIAFGNADVRLGAGLSDQPGVWAPDANGVNLRAFGEARREDRRLRTAGAESDDDEGVAQGDDAGGSSEAALP